MVAGGTRQPPRNGREPLPGVMLSGTLLLFAIAGLVACTVFLGLVVVAAWGYRRRPHPASSPSAGFPPVTLLKPVYGLEPNLENNLRSFFSQDYPDFEIIFGARDLTDPALGIVRSLQLEYPKVRTRIVVSGEPDRPNAKICSLEKMCAAATTPYLVISDSDVSVNDTYLREVVRPLLDPAVGLVTCLYRGVPTGGAWSALEAMGMSVEMTSGVMLADYCADDYVLGKRVFEAGYRVVLSEHVIDHIVIGRTLRASIAHQMRWTKSTRFSRPAGHIGAGLTYAMPFGMVGMGAALMAHRPLLAVSLLAWAWLNRVILALASGWFVVRDPRSLSYCWLYAIRDFTSFSLWCASFLGSTVLWRGGERYRLVEDGKMVRVGGPPAKPRPSGSV